MANEDGVIQSDENFTAMQKAIMYAALSGVSIGALRHLIRGFDVEDLTKFKRPIGESVVDFSISNDDRPRKKSTSSKGQYKFSSEKRAEGSNNSFWYDLLASPGRLVKGVMGYADRDPNDKTVDWSDPYSLPVGILGGGLALYGGYAGTDWLMKKYRKWRAQKEFDELKNEYKELLKEQYGMAKESALAEELDSRYEDFEKEAGAVTDTLGQLTGLGLTTAGAIWLLTHIAERDKVLAADKEKLRRQQMEARLKSELHKKPMPVLFEPEDITDDEEDKKKGMKLASSLTELSNLQFSPQQEEAVKKTVANTGKKLSQDKDTANLIMSGANKNKDQLQEGFAEAASEAINKNVPSFLLA